MTSRFLAGLATLALVLAPAAAQEKAASAADVRDLVKRYAAERAEALEKKFPPSSLERADEQLKRAEEALKAGNALGAAKLAREARWLLPYVPADLPPNVERILGIARLRHGEEVLALAWSPDGTRLASASKDASVRVWDLANGRQVAAYRGSQDAVLGLDWSRDGKWIASTAGQEIHLWDPATGKLGKALKGHEEPVTAVAFRPDSRTLASVSQAPGSSTPTSKDPSVRVWDLDKFEESAELGSELPKKAKAKYYAVAYSPNGKLLAATTDNGQLHVWNPDKEPKKRHVLGIDAHPGGHVYKVAFGKDTSVLFTSGSDEKAKQWVGLGPEGESIPGQGKPTAIEGHSQSVTALAATRDGKFLATGSADKTIRLWDLTGSAPRLARVFQGHTEEVTALAFAPDGLTLASGSKDQAIRLWTVSLADDHTNYEDHKGYVWAAAFNPDGQSFASAGVDRTVFVRDLAGKVLFKLEGATAPVTAVAYSADGSKVASVGGDAVVRVWDTKTGQKLKELKGHTAPIMAAAFGGNNLLLTGGIDKSARLWDVTKDEPVYVFPPHRTAVSAVALRADGKQALLGSADGMLRVFDLAGTPKETAGVAAHLAGVGAVTYGPDATKIATCGGDYLVKHWSVPGAGPPALLGEMKGHTKPVSSVAFNADGRLLASAGGDLVIRVWDLARKTELRALRGHLDWVSSVAFAPNGRSVLSASVDKTVKAWELSGEETARAVGHTRQLTTLAVSTDGRWVASGSKDKTIKIWDAAAGAEAFTLDATAGGHDQDPTALAFDPSGKRLLSAAQDGKLILWDLATRKPHVVLIVDMVVPFAVYSGKGDKIVAWQSKQDGEIQKENVVKTYDPEGKPLNSLDLKDRQIYCMAFSGDAELAALGFSDGTVQLWNLTTNERIGGDWAAFSKDFKDIAVSPDKKRVVAVEAAGNVKVYDVAGKKVVKEFQAHPGGLAGVLMNPDGTRFATMSEANEIKLWALEDGKELRSWKLPATSQNMAFSPDGKKLITANGDTTLFVLTLP